MELPSGHLGASCFQDSPFAFRQALDAVSGNFVEDRINFFADKLFGRHIHSVLFLRRGPGRALRFVNEHFGLAAEEINVRQSKARLQSPANKSKPREKSSKMRRMRHPPPGIILQKSPPPR